MYFTVEEAKLKQCCGPGESGRPNPSNVGSEVIPRLCSATVCMAWRWKPGWMSENSNYSLESPTVPPEHLLSSRPGFCGHLEIPSSYV